LSFVLDAGSKYTSFAFQQELDDHHVLQSIGSVGDAFDNALFRRHLQDRADR
jgi:hypothetical protein